jgi:hypothetical protein
MHGDLATSSAADVCRDLAARSATGVLAFDGPDGPGQVVFDGGRIVAARAPVLSLRLGDRLVGAGHLDDEDLSRALEEQGREGEQRRLGTVLVESGYVDGAVVRRYVREQVLDALFELLRWGHGTYAFVEQAPTERPTIPFALDVDDAMVEVARRHQQWSELSRVIPDLESVPSFRRGVSLANASLEPDEFAVLASVDGDRSIRDLAADLGYGEFEVARIVYGLTLLGIVEMEAPEDPVGAALDDALAFVEAGAAVLAEPTEPEPSEPEPAEPEPAEPEPAEPARPEPAPAETEPAEPEPTVPGPSGVEPGSAARVSVDADAAAPSADAVADAGGEEDPEASPRPRRLDRETSRELAATLRDLAAAEPEAAASRPAASSPSVHQPPGTEDQTGVVVEADLDGVVAEPDDGPEPPPAASRPADKGDVTEFLRELSRLALSDDEEAPPARETRRATPPPAPRREPEPRRSGGSGKPEGKRKRRGLFGRGG